MSKILSIEDNRVADKDLIAAFPLVREEYCCPQCESTIPLTHIVYAPTHKSISLSRQAMTICPVCRSGWRAHQILVDGVYRTVELDRITSIRDVERIQTMIDSKCGVRQFDSAA